MARRRSGGGMSPGYRQFLQGARQGQRLSAQAHNRRMREEAERAERLETLRSVTDRPTGELDAGLGTVDGHPALYEQGGVHGDPDRVDVYYGPQGPLGNPHGHLASNNGGASADYVREADGEVRSDSRRG